MPLSKAQEQRLIYLEQEEERYRATQKLLAFTKYTKPDYHVGWHHRVMCEKLDRFVSGEIKRLMIFMPPRHGKSELVSRRLPALIHGKYPDAELMATSYSGSLASDMTVDVQRIMDTPEYRRLFPGSTITAEGKKTAYARSSSEHQLLPIYGPNGEVVKKLKGKYRGQGVGGSFTGKGANFIFVDDPIKGREAADSLAFRTKLWKFYNGDLRSRLEKGGQVLITLTRWHEDDLAGRLLNLAKSNPKADQWEVISFPAIAEAERHPLDIRSEGEALWQDKFDLDALSAIRAADEREWQALYQQRPTAQEGGEIKRAWLKYYTTIPARFDQIIQSWDFTFKDGEDCDFAVGQVWGKIGPDNYLLHQVRDKMDIVASIAAVNAVTAAYPLAYAKYIEDKANGPAVIASLKAKISGLIPVNPEGSKGQRLKAVAPDFAGGNVHLPDPSIAPWIGAYVEELVNFPNAINDDQVDATTQALIKLRTESTSISQSLMEALDSLHSGVHDD